MKKKKNFTALSTVLAMTTGAAWADSGYFVLAGVGDSSADLDNLFLPRPSDDNDRSFEIGVGYAFNRYLAVQAAYHDFGKFDGQLGCPPDMICLAPPPIPFQAEISGWSLRVTGAYPLGTRFAAFASVGVLFWDVDLNFALEGGTAIFTNSTEGDDLLYEAGLRWRLSDRWNIQASYEKVNFDIESTKLGVLFRF